MNRYIRAFFLALKMTVRGEKPQQHPLVDWIRQTGILTGAILKAAEADGIDKQARQSLTLKLDGRAMSLETVLRTIQFHAEQEYPNLLQHGFDGDILNTIYATNFNDQYWISQVITVNLVESAAVQTAIFSLKAHLDQIPSKSVSS